jgi:protein-disulfide isomerase
MYFKYLVVIMLLLAAPLVTPGAVTKKASPKKIDTSVLKVDDNDFVIGNKNAKVVMIEYSSLSCPHCKDFHANIFKKIKEEYIDTGKVLYVYRSFPTNRSALAGSKLCQCVGKGDFFKMLATLFETQTSWAYSNHYTASLLNIAKLGGMSEAKFKECQEDKKLEETILKVAMDASNKLRIEGTPTFYINGDEISGERPFTTFKEIFDKKLSDKS